MLSGKKRIVVDGSTFKDLVRDQNNPSNLVGIPEAVKELGGVYLPYDDVDTLRVALGKYWDYEARLNEEGQVVPIFEGGEIFGPDHQPINIIYGQPISWDECANLETTYLDTGNPTPYGGTKQPIVLKSKWTGPLPDVKNNLAPGVDDTGFQLYQNNLGVYWTYLMKTGLIMADGTHLKPIVKTGTQFIAPNGASVYWHKEFFDHHHEAMSPYTPTELVNQQVSGKALYADYKTYYNNRTYSKNYESLIADPSLQNCLPNIIAFTKIISNPTLTEGSLVNLNILQELIQPWYLNKFQSGGMWTPDSPRYAGIRNDTYTDLFQKAPLEASFLLFGGIIAQYIKGSVNSDYPLYGLDTYEGEEHAAKLTLERLLTLDTKKQDADAVMKEYLKHFRNALLLDPRLNQRDTKGVTNRISPKLRVGALEFINSSLVFGSNAATILHKAKQYKDFFPMYFEMNFTSQETLLGDKIKEAKMTRFLGHEIAAAQKPFRRPGMSQYSQNNSIDYKFVDYVEKQVHENSFDQGFISIPAFSDVWTEAYKVVDKKMITLTEQRVSDSVAPEGVLDKWLEELDFSSTHNFGNVRPDDAPTSTPAIGPDPTGYPWFSDLRNYITYIKDDTEESSALDNDCNPIFKALFGAAFIGHLKSIYNEKARTYSDILDGVPAYSEDLFYLIKKFRKNSGENEEVCVQNIVIPNTSDLNIVEYVDTQVKYGAHATYRYEAHVYRVVFGSKYYYRFPDEDETHPISAGTDNSRLINPFDVDSGPIENLNLFFKNMTYQPWATVEGEPDASYDFEYTARVDVYVNPSIKLIGEQMFSTPEIKILDSPPVPPFVNIVPYRAISNKIKIILDGSTDTFRATPIIMLEGDQATFNDLLNSQFSHLNQGGDGKVKFSSDDKVANFQTFRIEKRPTSYGDFALHPNEDFAIIETGGSAAFDDSIEPNKKYYYTFRTTDDHGHVSNPTPVYEVELIDEKGAVKPLIRTISMEAKENKTHLKELQKYLLLRPTERQVYFSDASDVNSIFSADEGQSSKKKYKMRITSKGTGKKIDINFSFTKKEVT